MAVKRGSDPVVKKTNYINIRNARHSDIPVLIELLKALFTIEEDFVFDEEKQRRGLQLMLDDKENRCILTAECDNQVIGMISGQVMISTAEGGLSVMVEDVVIKEDYRGQGIGSRLIKAMESWATEKGALRMQLLADMNNSSALEFYKKLKWNSTKLICLQKKQNEIQKSWDEIEEDEATIDEEDIYKEYKNTKKDLKSLDELVKELNL